MSFCTNCGHPLNAEAKYCENCGQPVKQTSTIQPDPQPTLPVTDVNIQKDLKQVSKRQGSSKTILGIVAASIFMLLVVAAYFLFLKLNPEKEGKAIGSMICSCRIDSTKFGTESLKHFRDSFEKKQFKSKVIATDILNSLYSDTRDRYDSCYNVAMKKFTEKGKKFIKNNSQYQKFEAAFTQKQASCVVFPDPLFASIRSDILQKINALVDPEPTVDKIKADLLGKTMLGWRFDYLEEFQQFNIADKAVTDKRIEYDLDLTLLDQTKNSLHNASATVVYTMVNGKWVFNEVISNHITYTYRITNAGWQSVTLLPNTRYTITGNRYWVKDGDYGQTYKGGGTDGEGFNLTSTTIYLWSRESGSVDLVFTFYPKTN